MEAVSENKLAPLTGTERKVARRDAWEALLAAPNPPPRLFLGRLLVEVYESGDEPGRAALREIFLRGRLGWGVWQAAKRVYKLAEDRHDAEFFGILGWRFDAFSSTPHSSEIGAGTMLYLRRRVWRYLRHLGRAVPELYPLFAGQVLQHYTGDSFGGSWVASQVWGHKSLRGGNGRGGLWSVPKDLAQRAFPDAWKLSPAPLLRLLEDARSGTVCDFAIRSLEADFPETLRRPEPAWLMRLAGKRLGTVDRFLVKTLSSSPELHQSKLRGLGLHELALGLLRSQDESARKYAVEYARAHAPDLPVAELLDLVTRGVGEVKTFALAQLQARPATEIGLRALGMLLDVREAATWAEAQIRAAFRPASFDAPTFLALYQASDKIRTFVTGFYSAAKEPMPAAFLLELCAAEKPARDAVRAALRELGNRTGAELGMDWVKRHLDRPLLTDSLRSWVLAGKFKGRELDVEWLKGLVLRVRHRGFALQALQKRELVAPSAMGLPWLLDLARRPEEEVKRFAEGALLEGFGPQDFASAAVPDGVDRLFQLAAGKDQPDSVRAFAATYLKVHHPDLGPGMAEARQYAVTPKLGHDAYSAARVVPLLSDKRPDVRRLGVALARAELVRWGDAGLLYALADNGYSEVRAAGCELLVGIDPAAAPDPAAVPAAWLDPARVFALAESGYKVTRETALTVLRRHYPKLGSIERLGWLMDSPDREVQLAAVRLLWERHRPRSDWRPKGKSALPEQGERFESEEALRDFLRRLLFGLPPGRMEKRELGGDGAAPDKPLAARTAKRRIIEIARDLALADRDFAAAVVPVLEEFLASQAKGEWQGCVTALATLRAAYPGLTVKLPAPKSQPARQSREGA